MHFADMHWKIQKTPKSLKSALNSAVQTVNYVKAQPYNSKLFKMLCNDIGNKCEALILHTEFSWLSRAKVMLTAFQLSEELSIFLSEKDTISQLLLRRSLVAAAGVLR
jgi:hypothetical protein